MKKSATNTKLPCADYQPRPRCRRRSSIDFEGIPTMTKQSFAKECDINEIMKKYLKTGVVEHVNKHGGTYGDCPASTFQEALALVEQADAHFSELPAEARRRFKNDPASFLGFMENPENREEAILLGLVEAPPMDIVQPPETPPPAPVTSPGDS